MHKSRSIFRPVRSRLATAWDAVENSLWFVPTLMGLVAAALALGLPLIDLPDEGIFSGLRHPARNAPDFLATLLSSMITMATLAISITMVVLTLAANQLGFRLIRTFMGDLRTQIALGFFLATIVYLLLVLRGLPVDASETSQPALAIMLGTLLVLAAVAMLLFYVHHLARSIVADTLIHRVGDSLDAVVEQFLPDLAPDERQHPRSIEVHARTGPLRGREGGYIQAIDYDLLVGAACEADCVIELAYRPGHHVLAGGVHGWVSPPEARSPELEDAFASAVVLGWERTPVQDLEFAIRQLVEIALRALSPSMNDAFTAVAVINRLGSSMARIMRRPSAERGFPDGEGRVRVIAPISTFEGLVDIAFHQIRRSAADSPAVIMHLLETLAQLAELAEDPAHKQVIAEHVDLVTEAGRRAIAEPRDLAAMAQRRDAAMAALDAGVPVAHKDGLR